MKAWPRRFLLVMLAAGVIAAAGWQALDGDMRALIKSAPTSSNVLFWTVDQRDAGFRMLDRLGWLVEARIISRGNVPARALPAGDPLILDFDLDAYITRQRIAGLVILVDGKLVLERHGLGFGPERRWTSFSVAKSLTSTLVGAALQDGAIRSLDDKVSTYIPDLAGSVYDDVTLRQLLTMTSGVAWNEDYTDPQSDVARFNAHRPDAGMDATVSYMRRLPREAPAGVKWRYKTGETNLLGVLVSSATGKPLADYLSEKIWSRMGMEQDATWLLGSTDHEISGCCIQAATRDMARFGLFVLDGGRIGAEQVVPVGWFAMAGSKQAITGQPGRGYGFQWWTYDDGSFAAQGIFGQGIYLDPARRLVIATNGNWPVASNPQYWDERETFYTAVKAAVPALAAGQRR